MQHPEAHYTGTEGRKYHCQKRGIPEVAQPWLARHRARKLQRHANPDDVVVEFGMGWGWNLLELRVGRRIGVDLEEDLLASARAHGIEAHASTVGLPNGIADVALCYHALEHVLQPATVLGELARVLKSQGKLVLVLPFEKERRYRHYSPTEPNHHLYSWNVQSVGNLVRECGFTITEIGLGKYGYDRFAASLAVRLHAGENGFRLLRSTLVSIRPLKEIVLIARKLAE